LRLLDPPPPELPEAAEIPKTKAKKTQKGEKQRERKGKSGEKAKREKSKSGEKQRERKQIHRHMYVHKCQSHVFGGLDLLEIHRYKNMMRKV
jgi:hypothetical protein